VPTVTGQQPLKAGRPAAPAVRADKTPPATKRPVQQPNRKFQHRTGPSMAVVGGLLAAAFVVGLVLWVTMGADSGGGLSLPTTVIPGETTVPASQPVATGSIVGVHTFDPDGNGNENDDLAALAIDGNPATEWHTVCYSDKYLGGKGGVGLVVDLGAAATGTLGVDIGSAPYQLRVYAAPDGQEPTSFSGWGSPVDSFNGTAVRSVSVALASPARWALVSFIELGVNNDCANNPYRGAIRELTFG
jgi:hypothetical protein